MVAASRNLKNKNDEDFDIETTKSNLIVSVKIILAVVLITSIPVLFYNPDLSFGPLDVFRQDFFKTEILFSKTQYNTNSLIRAIHTKDLKMVKLFVRSGFNLNDLATSGDTPICIAAEKGDSDIVNILMQGDVNLLKKNRSNGLTPIFCAIKGNNVQILEKFAGAGVGINARSDLAEGIAPLHYAAALGLDNMVSYLVNNGANVNILDVGGQTPLHKAITQDNIVVLYVLLNSGADVDIEDNNGVTPLDLAKTMNKDVYEALLRRYTSTSTQETVNSN